jgi:hypothetical protein
MLHSRVTPQTLGVVRFWVFAIWLWMVARSSFYNFGELPPTVFKPVGVIAKVAATVGGDWILSTSTLYGFKLVLVAFLMLSMVGMQPYRPITILTALMLTFEQGTIRGVGYINHNTLPILIIVYILAVFPAADGFVWWKDKNHPASSGTYSAALLLMTLVLLLTYTTISVYRVAQSSPKIFLNDSMKYYIAVNTLPSTYYGWDLGNWVLASPALLVLTKIGFVGITFFEMFSPLCLLFRRFRYAWLAVIVPFHFLSLWLMNIFFWHNLLLIAVLLVDIDYWLAKLSSLTTVTARKVFTRVQEVH